MKRVAIARTSLVHNKTPLAPYLQSLLDKYGGLEWALNDIAGKPYCDVINNAVALGRELVITGDMSDASKWVVGTNWAVSGGVATASSVTTTQLLSQVILQLGRAYTVTYTVVVTSGTVSFNLGSTAVSTGRSASGTYTETLVCSGNTTFSFRATSGTFSGTIDNVSVKELNIPAYNAVPVQLLNADVWNGSGVTSWTAGAGSTISAATVTRHDGSSGTVLKIVRSSGSTPYASQTILTIGQVYRIYGWANTGAASTGAPRINNGATQIGSLNPSTDWTPFDLVFVATATDLRLGSNSGSGSEFIQFDVTVVALDTGIRQDVNVVLNGNFSSWSGGNPTQWVTSEDATNTITQDGSNNAVTFTGGASGVPKINQLALCIGKRYLATVVISKYTSGNLLIRSSGTTLVTASATGTFQVVFTASSTDFNLIGSSGSALTVSSAIVTELSPLVAIPNANVTLGVTENNRLLKSASFNGSNSVINLYSAQLNSMFNPNEGAIVIYAKVSASGVWTDGSTRNLLTLQVDANNNITIRKSSVNNTLTVIYAAGGTSSRFDISFSSTGWAEIVLTWSKSNDQVKAYINGVQVGTTLTGLGTWVGNLSSTISVLGASSTSGASPYSGFESRTLLLTATPSASEVLESAILGDCA